MRCLLGRVVIGSLAYFVAAIALLARPVLAVRARRGSGGLMGLAAIQLVLLERGLAGAGQRLERMDADWVARSVERIG